MYFLDARRTATESPTEAPAATMYGLVSAPRLQCALQPAAGLNDRSTLGPGGGCALARPELRTAVAAVRDS